MTASGTPCRIFLPEKLEATLDSAPLGLVDTLSFDACENQEYLLTFSKGA